ncbi:MAG TPA: SRPBCC domain-containing protein [Solirubrobacterales bacterium]|nr:SRPBCC domain-containing protein [Solirubrobacterales bacterium]
MRDPLPPEATALRLERTFKAPAQAVFEAWTSADMLRRWWPAGSDWETPVAEVDVRVGGRLRLVMRSPDGEEFGGGGEYVELTPPERLVFTWRWDGHAGHEGVQLIEVELSQRPDGTTTVVLTNRGLRDEGSKRSHRAGWEASFDNLDRVLAA